MRLLPLMCAAMDQGIGPARTSTPTTQGVRQTSEYSGLDLGWGREHRACPGDKSVPLVDRRVVNSLCRVSPADAGIGHLPGPRADLFPRKSVAVGGVGPDRRLSPFSLSVTEGRLPLMIPSHLPLLGLRGRRFEAHRRPWLNSRSTLCDSRS